MDAGVPARKQMARASTVPSVPPKGISTMPTEVGKELEEACRHSFVVHLWCDAHGRFFGGAAAKHTFECTENQHYETTCDKCGDKP